MPHYFDDAHRQQIETLRQRFTARTDWPTWLLLIGVYGSWFAVRTQPASRRSPRSW